MPSNSPEQRREERRQELWQKDLGMPAPEWLDESLAPPLTDDALARLEKYAMNEIADDSDEYTEITALTCRFKLWSAALVRVYDKINQDRD